MSSDLLFRLASPDDNAELLRLLSENWIGGRFPLSLERSPDAFGAVAPHHARDLVVASVAATGRIVGMCERVVRPAFVNGQQQHLPYLTALRVAPSHRHRIGVLKGGFQTLRLQASRPSEMPFALTSITSDNAVAKRVLTAGLKGLPTYRPAADYSTLVLRHSVGRMDQRVSVARDEELGEVATFLQRELARFQFSPFWTEEALRSIRARFLVRRSNGKIDGCISLWDQRSMRQVVVRGYPRTLRAARPLVNAIGPFTRLPHLPQIGSPIAQAYLSHLAVAGDDAEATLSLVRAGLRLAGQNGLQACSIGLPSAHPFREVIRKRLSKLEYRTSLYLVHWPDGADAAAACDDRLAMPDIGLL